MLLTVRWRFCALGGPLSRRSSGSHEQCKPGHSRVSSLISVSHWPRQRSARASQGRNVGAPMHAPPREVDCRGHRKTPREARLHATPWHVATSDLHPAWMHPVCICHSPLT